MIAIFNDVIINYYIKYDLFKVIITTIIIMSKAPNHNDNHNNHNNNVLVREKTMQVSKVEKLSSCTL